MNVSDTEFIMEEEISEEKNNQQKMGKMRAEKLREVNKNKYKFHHFLERKDQNHMSRKSAH